MDVVVNPLELATLAAQCGPNLSPKEAVARAQDLLKEASLSIAADRLLQRVNNPGPAIPLAVFLRQLIGKSDADNLREFRAYLTAQGDGDDVSRTIQGMREQGVHERYRSKVRIEFPVWLAEQARAARVNRARKGGQARVAKKSAGCPKISVARSKQSSKAAKQEKDGAKQSKGGAKLD